MFTDRVDAGRRLARALGDVASPALILGIPRGGVLVARAIADMRDDPLDVLVVRKLGAPGNPELAIGAIGPDGEPVWDEDSPAYPRASAAFREAELARQRDEVIRRVRRYRGDAPALRVEGRRVILVDDGIATGSTARAALRWLRAHDAAWTVLAVPVASPYALRTLDTVADDIVCLIAPSDLTAVGRWYAHFDQVADDEVIAALTQAA